MAQEEKKSSYFSNGDFEKVAADIISSPRRLKHTSPGKKWKIKNLEKNNRNPWNPVEMYNFQQNHQIHCFESVKSNKNTTQNASDTLSRLHR